MLLGELELVDCLSHVSRLKVNFGAVYVQIPRLIAYTSVGDAESGLERRWARRKL